MTPRWIDSPDALNEVVAAVSRVERYAIDTEFHRERTYYPRLALVQIAWDDEVVLVDPLATDPKMLAPLFESPALAVFHAAQQDLDVLAHTVGVVPEHLFDTQLAAAFVGYSTPSLVNLTRGELDIVPSKGDRLTDWLARPLTDAQLAYAASDVEHLLEIQDRLIARLTDRGRVAWAEDACEELRQRPVGPNDPMESWLRLKDVRSLRPRNRAVAQAVAAWREREAQSNDVPVRQVLSDLGILGIAQRQPTSEKDLRKCRGVDDRHLRGRIGRELLAAIEEGRAAEPPELPTGGDDLGRNLRPAVALVSAWVSQVARDNDIDTAMLATRSDLIALLSGAPDAKLQHGWRAEVIGDGIARLLAGEAGLTFDGDGRLELIDAS